MSATTNPKILYNFPNFAVSIGIRVWPMKTISIAGTVTMVTKKTFTATKRQKKTPKARPVRISADKTFVNIDPKPTS
jgi:hypothetical protein